jgi:hypothetical protein
MKFRQWLCFGGLFALHGAVANDFSLQSNPANGAALLPLCHLNPT